jgi:CBS-domain-containing membrane protein
VADNRLQTWRAFLGIEGGIASHREKLVSALGGFVAICGILALSQFFLGAAGAALIVASMGASTVLLFAVPHGPLSQPWALMGGHLVSALIGVSCARWVPVPLLAAGLAVGLAVGAMYYLRCIHPPGGATALVAVVGGEPVHALGYQFVLTPVLMNVAIILAIAVAFNYAFPWRRYPAYLVRRAARGELAASASAPAIAHSDFVYALTQLDSYVDVSEEDLLRIYTLATGQAQRRHLTSAQIVLWHVYGNGEAGEAREIRDIIDESRSDDPAKDKVIFRVLWGPRRRDTGVMTRAEFARWAKQELVRSGADWVPVEAKDPL